MKTIAFISALLLASASLQAQPEAKGYQFTTVVNQKVTPVKIRLPQAPAGALPPLPSLKQNYSAREKANTTFRKCTSSVRNT